MELSHHLSVQKINMSEILTVYYKLTVFFLALAIHSISHDKNVFTTATAKIMECKKAKQGNNYMQSDTHKG